MKINSLILSRRVAFCLFFGLAARQSPAATITATTNSLAAVQTAVNAAAAGDTVKIPAGSSTWGAGGTSLSIDKAITLAGAGQDVTNIDISPTAGSWTSGVISISAAATIKGLTLRTPTTGGCGTAFSASGSANGFRITDIKYLGQTTTINGYFVYSDAYGLVDNCSVTGGSGENELIFLRGPANSWQTNSTMGGANNFFIEDCTFGGEGYVTDCNSNSRCVVRFCTITGPIKIDGHGKYSNTPPRGVRHMEVYNNTWTGDGYWAAMELRGGTGRVFNNTAPNTTAVWLLLNEYYVINDGYTAANYPVDDQIGVGKDPKVGGSEPMYLWGNRENGAIWAISSYPPGMTGVINPDRDYYNEVAPFNGTSGVGIGTAAQMSAITPTKANVAFWVTDQGSWNSNTAGNDGVLYVWNGTAWVLNYKPYTYPHPLRSVSSADTTAPTVPTGLAGSAASATQINLTWNASTDNVGVVGYGIYRNSNLVDTTVSPGYSDKGLTAGTTYAYSVNAYDISGNVSAKSTAINVTTLSATSSSSSSSSSGASSSSSGSSSSSSSSGASPAAAATGGGGGSASDFLLLSLGALSALRRATRPRRAAAQR